MAKDWKIKGCIKGRESETTGKAQKRPLANIEVEVSASLLKKGGFASWGKTRTDSRGRFELQNRKSSAKRRFRVKIRLKDAELEVKRGALSGPLQSKWETVYESEGKQSGPIVDIRTHCFEPGAGGDLGDQEAIRRAAFWYACNKVIATLKRKNSWFAFKKRIHVAYPAPVISGSSYANGITRTAYIMKNHGNIDTVLHEIMHLWNYDHNYGTSNWLQAVCDGTTHAFQEKPAIAFHEGFAEYAKNDLFHQIWGKRRTQPWNRRYLASKNLTTPALVEGSDDGVTRALHLLTTPDLYTRTFGTRTSSEPWNSSSGEAGYAASSNLTLPKAPDLTLWDVMKVFRASPRAGWKRDWQVGNPSYGLLRFFERAADILPSLNDETKDLMLALLDAQSSVEPQSKGTTTRRRRRLSPTKKKSMAATAGRR